MSADITYTCLYFGYGNSLSPRTLKQRCPESAFAGLARLDGYRWQINEVGLANIVPSEGDHVYGSLAFLSGRDEAALDLSENVPHHYAKQDISVTRIDGDGQDLLRADGTPQKVTAVVHIDIQRTTDGTVNPEYILWINRAIRDATKEGLRSDYAEKYIRPFVPDREETEDERSTNMVVSRLVEQSPKHSDNMASDFRMVWRHPRTRSTGLFTAEEAEVKSLPHAHAE